MTTPIALAYHDDFLAHGPDWGMENRHRLEALTAHLRASGFWDRLAHLGFAAADEATLSWLHSPEYVEEVHSISALNGGYLAPSTYLTATSYDVARLAVGGCLAAVGAVLSGEARSALCLVRPPGHHAGHDHGGGFCVFNNAALAAEFALHAGLSRVAIVDFDVHHGNGTQDLFYHRGDVLFASVHQMDLYPGTGTVDEVGIEAGFGATVNVPLPEGACDGHYSTVFRRIIVPALRLFEPEFIIVSAGYDAHYGDPIAQMSLTASAYHDIAAQIQTAADALCAGRTCFILEGGYDEPALCSGVENTLKALWGEPPLASPPAPPVHPETTSRVETYLQHAIELHSERLGLGPE